MDKDLNGEFILKPTPKEKNTHPEKKETPKSNPSVFRDEKRPAHFYSSYVSNPDGVVMQNQEEDEEIILLIRRHFITNVPWLFITIVGSILPLFLIPFLPTLIPFLQITGVIQTLYISFYYILLFGYAFINFALWYFHVALVSTKRIIDVDVTGILFKNVAETKLDLIQDFSYTQNGALRSIFNYGDVLIQTAGNLPNFEFDKAPKPAEITRIISDLVGEARENQ